MTAAAEVAVAGPDARGSLFALLTLAFSADPFTRWVFEEPATFLRGFPLALSGMGGGAFTHGTAHLAEGGAALWLPPGVWPDYEALAADLAPLGLREEAGAVFGEAAAMRPEAAHWYLPFIGVDPLARGRGVGSRLLEAGLQMVDATGAGAWLESTNARNIPLYERYGFQVVADLGCPDGPRLWPMWRAPRAT